MSENRRRLPALTKKQLAKRYEAPDDNGFFGPGSVTWKVWGYPTSTILGFARSVTIEHFDPNLAAAVVQSGGVKYRPQSRYNRTMRYFAMVAFGATEATAKAADILVKVHSKAIGHDPVTGGEYDANKPSSQLWIHMTAWHSILYCYEKFGPGPLPAHEEEQFWAECARAAELQTIDPDTVPRSREAVRTYFEEWRPHLAGSEAAQDMIHFILALDVALPDRLPPAARVAFRPMLALLRRAVISTYPRHLRDLAGIRQSRVTDALVRMPTKAFHSVLARSTHLQLALMNLLSPAAVEPAAPFLLDIPAKNPITMTPREAQTRYGYDIPSQAHHDMRDKQRRRVFEDGQAPSDDGLLESEQHIGSLAGT